MPGLYHSEFWSVDFRQNNVTIDTESNKLKAKNTLPPKIRNPDACLGLLWYPHEKDSKTDGTVTLHGAKVHLTRSRELPGHSGKKYYFAFGESFTIDSNFPHR